jgi:MoxR-like ATPase
MLSRHQIDTSKRYDRDAALRESQWIEVAEVAEVGEEFRTHEVRREPYIASPELAEAVNLAIALGRPLLLQGDPGAGKTRLAHALAYALELPLEQAHIKSTSRGQDLLYSHDAIRRLFDVQTAEPGQRREALEPSRYVRLGPLGRAIVRATFGRRSVLLIDEIDKADIDFPNDLLRELDRLAFDVAEVPGMSYAVAEDRPELRPIIVVTNNEEKTLPDAFLRRCVFHYVEFPSQREDLEQILELHEVQDRALSAAAVEVLLELRELDLTKKPGLSELLDWVHYLEAVGATPDQVRSVPHPGALVKQYGDTLKVRRWQDSGA